MGYRPLIALVALAAAAQDFDLSAALKKIENRYNTTKTLRSDFEQTVQVAQGRRGSERGVLYLRKPGQMRWEYANPAGKLFLTDGKTIYYVSPAARRAEISPMKESDDLRAPLAFLLGKLDFAKDFGRYEINQKDSLRIIRAFPKSDKTLFEYVEFTPNAEGALLSVAVQGKDGSRMDYSFRNENRNLALDSSLFLFRPPEGFTVVNLRTPQ